MAYPLEADLETAISNVETALLENRILRNGEAAWAAWQEVVAHLINVVSPDASYGALARSTAEFGGV